MKLIDRYIYGVTRYLPENIRKDVSLELKSHILEMLSDEPTEAEISAVLEGLGNPQQLANEYQPQKRYLIGPNYYNQYLEILKLVTSIAAIVLLVINVIDWGFSSTGDLNIVRLISSAIGAVINGAIQGAIWVTVIFAILERGNFSDSDSEKWSIKDLPDLPVEGLGGNRKVSKFEVILEMVGTIVFVGILYFHPQILAIHSEGMNPIMFFQLERLTIYIPFILGFGLIQLAMSIWTWTAEYWTKKMEIINLAFTFLSCLLTWIMFQDQSLINPEISTFLNEIGLGASLEMGVAVTLVLICLLSGLSLMRRWRKLT